MLKLLRHIYFFIYLIMKIVINIPNDIISKLKYTFLGIFIISMIAYAYFFKWADTNVYLLLATIFAIYMAINLWANDVANNMGPAVWAKAISLPWAIAIAMIFEAAWAIIAGWDVVNTIKWWIIDPNYFQKWSIEFISIMLATLLGSAVWVNIATFFKAPVSITHSVLWGLIWAWITAAGLNIVNWPMVIKVIIALIIAIFMWGIISTIIFISIRKTILKQKNRWEAAKHWVPIYVAIMTWVFTLYLILKWFKHKLWPVKEYIENLWLNFTSTAIFISIIIAIIIYIHLIIKFKNKKKSYFEDSKDFVNKLFNVPLIFAVALLSFAHWANDVANAIGPLAAIYDATIHAGQNLNKVWVPFWIMILWALSLSFWLAVFGTRLIKTVGKSITKLDQTRAYSIALAAAVTVIIASALGIPVSTTQIALGWIFGIWLFRQYLKIKNWKDKKVIEMSKLKWIILSWVITFPVAWIIASIIYLSIIYLSK